jgi:hypothetical protein
MCSAKVISKSHITEYIVEFHECIGENEVREWCTLNLLHSIGPKITSVTRIPSIMDSVTSNNQSCIWKIQISS